MKWRRDALNDRLLEEGVREAPEPSTAMPAESEAGYRPGFSVVVLATAGVVAGTLIGLDELGIVNLPETGAVVFALLVGLALSVLVDLYVMFRSRHNPRDDDDD